MSSRLRRVRPSASMIVALVALFVSLAGGAYAAFHLPKDSVTSKNVKDGSLRPQDLETIVAKPHGSSSVQTGTSASPTPYPLNGSKWTQAKGEVEEVVMTVTYTSPASCSGLSGFHGGNIMLDGKLVSSVLFDELPESTKHQATSTFTLPASAATGSHTLTLEVYDSCSGAGENFTVSAVSADILAFR